MSNRPTKRPSSSVRVAQAQRASESSRTTWIFVALGVVVAVAVIVAIAVSSSKSSSSGGGSSPGGGTVVPSGNLAYGSLDTTGDPIPQLPSSYDGNPSNDPAVTQTAPGLRGQTFDGSQMTVSNDGKPKVVMFVAHWCPHCQKEVPAIQQWLDGNGMPADVELVAVATGTSDTKPNYPPGDWLRREKWSVPTMLDDKQSSAAKAFGVTGYPFFVAVDANGKVVERATGELSIAQWEALLNAARNGSAGATQGTAGASSPATSQ